MEVGCEQGKLLVVVVVAAIGANEADRQISRYWVELPLEVSAECSGIE